ncbi:hypothetical protein PMPD1_0735 [Paramixta manurensis]|uniref:Uncharacterized protein n=1 Tax=Paramixta manurensis TaxID=2740817 RepID=A0A6M8UBA6_9GAMM|nr:hypothetical protein PMPD1_0735 [Erwiniaceae bacterium PD-1]
MRLETLKLLLLFSSFEEVDFGTIATRGLFLPIRLLHLSFHIFTKKTYLTFYLPSLFLLIPCRSGKIKI